MKTSNVSEIYWFKKKREISLAVALLLTRPRTLVISSLAFFKNNKFQTRWRFSCENLAFLFFNKKARLEIASDPNWTPYIFDVFAVCK